MAFLLVSVLILALSGLSSGTYCVCKDGGSDAAWQKALDYACGAGADCTPIQQNGACYNPNTVKSHCDYAVNSYFQKKGQASGSCDFAGAATPTSTTPTGQSSTCVYPTSGSTSTPTPSTGTTPPTSTTPSTTPTTPTTTPVTPTTPTTSTSPTTSTTPTTPVTSGTTLGPTGVTPTSFGDSNDAGKNTIPLVTLVALGLMVW